MKSGEFRVEELSEVDATEIERLFKEVWPNAEEYPRAWRNARMIGQKDILEEMKSGVCYFGIREHSRIVGLYKANITGDTVVGEHQSVHPNYRRKGMAEAMYEQFLRFAKHVGCKKVLVNVLPSQLASTKIVKKHGFVKIKEYEQIPGMLVHLYQFTF
jgi:predicted acetyltransferase